MATNIPATGSRASAEANEEIARRYFDAMERGALDEALEFWAQTVINHASGRYGEPPPVGRERMAMVFRMLRTAFPDRRYTIDEIIAAGDQVVCRMTISGTFGATPQRPPGELPPDWVGVESTELVPKTAAGKPYSIKHIHIFRIANGQITEHWAARDDLGLLLQLGAITPPNKSGEARGEKPVQT